MFFLFLILSGVGGFMAARGIGDGDYGLGFLGILIVVVSCVANGFIGFPGV